VVAHARQVLLRTRALIVPVALVAIVAAPQILALLGSAYADEGATLLPLLALSSTPNVGIEAVGDRSRFRPLRSASFPLCFASYSEILRQSTAG
jgi:hypothetical protein